MPFSMMVVFKSLVMMSVHYDLSEDFILNQTMFALRKPKETLKVAADGELYAPSGKILSEEELERQKMEEIYLKENRMMGGDEEDGEGVPLVSNVLKTWFTW